MKNIFFASADNLEDVVAGKALYYATLKETAEQLSSEETIFECQVVAKHVSVEPLTKRIPL